MRGERNWLPKLPGHKSGIVRPGGYVCVRVLLFVVEVAGFSSVRRWGGRGGRLLEMAVVAKLSKLSLPTLCESLEEWHRIYVCVALTCELVEC